MLRNDQILVEAEKKSKKGDGIKAVLTLTQELRDFQEQVENCLESQDLAEIRDRIEAFDDSLNTMYNELLDIAKGNMKSLRTKDEDSEDSEDLDGEIEDSEVSESKHPLEAFLGAEDETLEPVEVSISGSNVFDKLNDYGPLFPKAPVRPLR